MRSGLILYRHVKGEALDEANYDSIYLQISELDDLAMLHSAMLKQRG